MKDKDTGEAQSSPIVWNKYANTNQYIADSPLAANCAEAAVINKKPNPIIIVPTAILNKEDASLFLLERLTQYPATVVPNKIIKAAFKDWNTEAGIVKTKKHLLYLR